MAVVLFRFLDPFEVAGRVLHMGDGTPDVTYVSICGSGTLLKNTPSIVCQHWGLKPEPLREAQSPNTLSYHCFAVVLWVMGDDPWI